MSLKHVTLQDYSIILKDTRNNMFSVYIRDPDPQQSPALCRGLHLSPPVGVCAVDCPDYQGSRSIYWVGSKSIISDRSVLDWDIFC
jgi:hypothetical protein